MKYRHPINIYAAWRKDEEKLVLSSSGGFAASLSEKWVNEGGVVYGAAFVPPFSVRHIRCTTLEEVSKLRGSKYVQSDMTGIYSLIEKDIEQSKSILFFGTPCQVAGVVNRFNDKIFTVDLICHGTPSFKIFESSIPFEIKSLKIDNIQFRKNTEYRFSILYNNTEVWSRPLKHDLYLKGFFTGLFFRECCYHCHYARAERISDITIGDFWGINKNAVNCKAENGVSLVMANTTIGKQQVQSLADDIVIVHRTLDEAIINNTQLVRPKKKTFRSILFHSLYPYLGFKWATIFSIPDIVIRNLLR